MDEIEALIQELQGKGWSGPAIAAELGVSPLSVHRWAHGQQSPHNSKLVITALRGLLRRKPSRGTPGPKPTRRKRYEESR